MHSRRESLRLKGSLHACGQFDNRSFQNLPFRLDQLKGNELLVRDVRHRQ
eukprot:m.577616 g.577616  ORF g.577616 m.577616 type:complete len:50 (+) comp57915_c0_seq2:68-217(+)